MPHINSARPGRAATILLALGHLAFWVSPDPAVQSAWREAAGDYSVAISSRNGVRRSRGPSTRSPGPLARPPHPGVMPGRVRAIELDVETVHSVEQIGSAVSSPTPTSPERVGHKAVGHRHPVRDLQRVGGKVRWPAALRRGHVIDALFSGGVRCSPRERASWSRSVALSACRRVISSRARVEALAERFGGAPVARPASCALRTVRSSAEPDDLRRGGRVGCRATRETRRRRGRRR